MDLIEAPLLKYQPLREPNSIRLLILQPGPLGSEIRCSLVYTTVSDCRNDIYDHYTALSYVWGDPTDTTTIIVDGQPFQATVNLAAALDDLRDDERPLRMWVDAICINQASILERNTQVGLMRDIYSTAQRTVVYLGKSASDFDHILRDLRSAKEAKAAWETIEEETRKSFTIQFLSYPWFTRVWIYQELVLSREVWVQCGRVRIAWDKLCNILIGVDRSKLRDRSHNQQGQMELLSSMFETREKFKMSLIDGSKPQSLRQILSTRRGMGVSDLRDMIFGHLAVAGLHQPEVVALGNFPPPTADYTKTIPEVFTNAASYIYTSSDTVELLLDVEVSNCSRRLQSLPSWVPDWSLAPS
ncbi:heterokaryon incompatibility protein-domain-containing protein, partial [Halenospora varia]